MGNISDPHIDQIYPGVIAEPDEATRNQMIKDLTVYAIEANYRFPGPHQYEYHFWQPWLKNMEGAAPLGHWGTGNSFAYYWVDQDMKEQMTGRR